MALIGSSSRDSGLSLLSESNGNFNLDLDPSLTEGLDPLSGMFPRGMMPGFGPAAGMDHTLHADIGGGAGPGTANGWPGMGPAMGFGQGPGGYFSGGGMDGSMFGGGGGGGGFQGGGGGGGGFQGGGGGFQGGGGGGGGLQVGGGGIQ